MRRLAVETTEWRSGRAHIKKNGQPDMWIVRTGKKFFAINSSETVMRSMYPIR